MAPWLAIKLAYQAAPPLLTMQQTVIAGSDANQATAAASALWKPWLEWAGELAHLHQKTVRIQKLIDDEFGQIEPADWAFRIS